MSARLPVTAILSGTLFLIGISSAAIAPYRAIVAIDGLHLSNSVYALVTTVSAIGTAVVSLLLGHFADRIPDRRWGVLVCSVFAALAYALIFIAPSQLSYVISFCVILPFGGALFSQSFSFSRAYYNRTEPKRAEFMMSVLRTLFSLAWVVAPPLAGWVASSYSVFDVFAAAAGAQVICLVVFWLLFVFPDTKVGAPPKKDATAEVREASGIPVNRLVGIGGVTLIRIAIFLHLMTLPLILTNDFHGTLADVGFNAAIAAALEIPFMLAWGAAATRMPKELIIAVSALLYALYLGLVFFSHSVANVLWLQGLNAIATAAVVSIPISYLQETIKGRLGLSTALLDVVTVVGSMSASGIFALFSTHGSYLPVFAAASILCVAGAAAMLISRSAQSRVGTAV